MAAGPELPEGVTPEDVLGPEREPTPAERAAADIAAAREAQRGANAAAAKDRPVVELEPAHWEIDYRRDRLKSLKDQIAELEKQVEAERPNWEKVRAERQRIVEKTYDYSISKRARSNWEKKLAANAPEYDRLRDIVEFAPYRLKAWGETIAESESKLAALLADPANRREIKYAELQGRHPDLIPPGHIAERIKSYAVGDAKVKAIVEAAERYEKEDAELATERTRLNKAIAAKLVEQADAVTAHMDDDGTVRPEGHARSDAIQKEIDAIAAEKEAIRGRQKSLDDRRRAEFLGYLKTDKGATFEAGDVPADYQTSAGPLYRLGNVSAPGADPKARVKEAEEWLGQVVRVGDVDAIRTRVGAGFGYRAHFNNGQDHIQMDVHEKTDVVVHEFGHAIDYRLRTGDDPVVKRSLEFLAHRVGDEKPVDMKSTFGTGDAGEMGRGDEFGRAFGSSYRAHYVGKDYGRDATEIVSMGLELLYNDPMKFAKNDPEFFKFIVGICDGSLR